MVHLQVSPCIICARHILCLQHQMHSSRQCLHLLKVLVVQSFHRWDGCSVASRLGMQVCSASTHLSLHPWELAVAMLRHVIRPGNTVGKPRC